MRRQNLKLRTLITIIAVSATVTVTAQGRKRSGDDSRPEPPSFSKLLKIMDENEDGKLSKEEIKGPLKDDFDKVDANEDGYITEEELKKAPKPKKRRDN